MHIRSCKRCGNKMSYENEMCQYMECKNQATGSTTIRLYGFKITIYNCDKHKQNLLKLSDKWLKGRI